MPKDKETEAHQLVTKLERFIESIIDVRGPMARPDHGINHYHDAKKQLKDVLEDWVPDAQTDEPFKQSAFTYKLTLMSDAKQDVKRPEHLTSDEWLQQPEFEGITVLDADGWDRDNFHQSWTELITKTQFIIRLSRSTISAPARFFK